MFEVDLTVDDADLQEALAVIRLWANRADQMPQHLRREIAALLALRGAELNEVRREGPRLVVGPSPRLLVLVANLRAQEARAA